ncbi:hypothetical protein ICNINCKA_00686 [Synechococcus sp. CBW1107]|nr:hypothetical protein ICNINCKA_00686 [Synechococcus sp. CBW1107]
MMPSTTLQLHDVTSVFDFSQSLSETTVSETPAALTEALLPEITDSFWLLVSTNALINTTETQVLRMILERALPGGVSIALDVDWRPDRWGLAGNAAPTSEVLRRFRPLAQSAQFIRCGVDEAEAFFSSADPAMIQERLPQRPAVLITDRTGGLLWSIGGRKGRMAPMLVEDHDTFLVRLLDNLCSHPTLLGNAGPGIDAIADPDALAEQLLSAAAPIDTSADCLKSDQSAHGAYLAEHDHAR